MKHLSNSAEKAAEHDSFSDAAENIPQAQDFRIAQCDLATEMRRLTDAVTAMRMDVSKTSTDEVADDTPDSAVVGEKEVVDSKSDETAEEPVVEPAVEPGMDKTAKELYRKERYHDWEELEGDLPEDDDEKYKKYALVVRHERDPDGGNVLLHSVKIQSPHVRDFLTKVFEGYRGVYTNIRRLTLRPPYHEFYYRWDKFQELLEDIKDELAKEHIELLHKVIAPEIKPHLEAKDDMIKQGVISYDYLWALFPPDTEVYAHTESGERLYMARRCWYRKNLRSTTFIVDCEYIDYNGSLLGYGTDRLEIDQYGGHTEIAELNPIPTSFVSKIEDVRRKLTARGRSFEKLIGVHYTGYSGLYLPHIPRAWLQPRKRHIENGRVVIDAKLFHEQDPDKKPRLRPLDSDIKEKEKADDDYDYYQNVYDEEENYGRQEEVKPGRLTLKEEEYCYCSPFVTGYNLTSKQWATFEAARVIEVQWSHDAFEKLVLPFDYKELILSFAESQLSHKDNFDDIMAGKGQGFITLLSGEPGVGKTLTAEAVSEQMRCPLYAMSAGELGSDAAEVEENLEKVLEICAKWGAVLLLDECDVFLEERTLSDIHRNKLVSVFLRLLEYFKGLMFLTTNRVSSFDSAFQSRIHLTINYPALDQASRRAIWETFVRPNIELQHKSTVTAVHLDELAGMRLNGREIKNIVKTARLLSNRKNVGLGIDHIRTVLRIKQDSVSNSIIAEDD
ncbi:hypothetical protein LTS08_007713 [Lithohypha guttulata]|nr:hypothetical protein LTS08_007713 [Lithohypha guttulata]